MFNRGPFALDARSESTNLDFLRSCAIFFVVLFHILLYFQHTSTLRGHLNLMPIGHFGVLIFFVHTSLVLLSLERQDSRAPGAPLFTPFLIRRIFRIFPLSILVVVLVELFRVPVGHLLHATGILSNIFLLRDLTHTDPQSRRSGVCLTKCACIFFFRSFISSQRSGALRFLSLFFGSLRSLQARALATLKNLVSRTGFCPLLHGWRPRLQSLISSSPQSARGALAHRSL